MPDKDEKISEEVQLEQESIVEEQVDSNPELAEAELSETISEAEVELDNSVSMPDFSDDVESREPAYDPDQPVTVKPVQFASFEDLDPSQGEINKNLDILMDIKLQLTVELGRTELPIRKVLELTRGSIIELEKVAGEPVELYANGKLVAHGEVVVIEDNFGLRITSITEPEDRISGI